MDQLYSLFGSYSGHFSRQIESASTAPRIGTTSIQLLYLFLVFQLFSQIFLPILIVTFVFSKSVKRHPTVVNVCMTWIITGVISSLLWVLLTTKPIWRLSDDAVDGMRGSMSVLNHL